MDSPNPPPKILDPYIQLPFKKTNTLEFSSAAPFTPTYVISNLSLSSDPAAAYATRIKGRQMLLENPARDSKLKQELQAKRERREKDKERKKLKQAGKRGNKAIRERGLWKLDESQAKFRLFIPLHQLWMGYMSELLGLSQKPMGGQTSASHVPMMPHSGGMHPKLLKADFHGSIMTVCRSKNPCLIGVSGIVFHETENAFKIVTKEDKIKLIPKQNSIFVFAVPLYSTLPPNHDINGPLPLPPSANIDNEPGSSGATSSPPSQTRTVLDDPHIEFELYGNQFRFRAADRAGRKFKHKETIEL